MSDTRRLDADLENELIDVARELADAARVETLKYFRVPGLAAENKASDEGWDPVTAGDRNAESAMRDILARRRPRDGVLGEEFESFKGESGLDWVLDPIDGTRSFISGAPLWGVLIAVSDECGPLYGIIDQPYIGERFEGGFGRTLLRGPMGRRNLETRRTRRLEDAVLFSTFPEIGTGAEREAFHRLSARTRMTRYGTDCYGYALLAAGHIDLVVEAGLNPYDIHAPIAVVLAAGGVATDWEGNGPHDKTRMVAAANPEIHREALAALEFSGCG